MNYRGLILSLIGLVVIITGIVFAVRGIRHKDEEPNVDGVERTALDSHFPLLTAVPSDAAVIFSFAGDRDAAALLTDSTSIIPPLMPGISRRFVRSVASRKIAVSLHDAGQLTPLMIIDMEEADSASLASITHLADTLGIKYDCLTEYGLLLASPSETLIGSSKRHVEGGFSVLENRELRSAAATLPYGNAVFFSHAAASRIIRTLLTSTYNPYAPFLSKAAVWTALTLPKQGENRLEGYSANFGNTGYQSLFTGMTPGEFKFPDVVPSESRSVMALATDDIGRYFPLRRKWLDASGRLGAYKEANNAAKKSLGAPAEQYAADHKLREVVAALLPSGERLVGLRFQERPDDGDEIRECRTGYALSMLFGEEFRPQGDSLWSLARGNWKWIGSRDALASLGNHSLRESSDAENLLPERGVFVLYNAGNTPSDVLAVAFSAPVRARFRGNSRIASCLSALPSEGGVHYDLAYGTARFSPQSPRRVTSPASASATAAADPSASSAPTDAIPGVEFQVRNFRTGKMNTFFQQPDGRLGLRSETGSVLWTVPFDKPIASGVAEVDYYDNEKIQYLFAAGSRLYIIDVLGRFIPSFETDLGKEVLLGPALYPFEEGDALMVLHKDNSIALYTLDGSRYPGWKDIASKEAVSALPEMLTVEGERYWKVAFPSGTKYYRFGGGSPLGKGKTKKLLKKTVLKSE